MCQIDELKNKIRFFSSTSPLHSTTIDVMCQSPRTDEESWYIVAMKDRYSKLGWLYRRRGHRLHVVPAVSLNIKYSIPENYPKLWEITAPGTCTRLLLHLLTSSAWKRWQGQGADYNKMKRLKTLMWLRSADVGTKLLSSRRTRKRLKLLYPTDMSYEIVATLCCFRLMCQAHKYHLDLQTKFIQYHLAPTN